MPTRPPEETSRRAPVTRGAAAPGAEDAGRRDDVRGRGFADRAPVERAQAWVDTNARVLEAEELGAADAVGRVLAGPVVAGRDVPAVDVAGEDGWAVRAAETAGASAWAPVVLRLEHATPTSTSTPTSSPLTLSVAPPEAARSRRVPTPTPTATATSTAGAPSPPPLPQLALGERELKGLPAGEAAPVAAGGPLPTGATAPVLARNPLLTGAAAPVAAGDPLPIGADAILGFELGQVAGATLEVIGGVAEGNGIARAGQLARAGAPCGPTGRPLRPADAALLAAAGVERVRVVRAPRVRLAVNGPKGGGAEAHVAMLRALLERDGAVVEVVPPGGGPHELVRRAAAAPGADAIVVTGRTGTGPDDEAPLALAELGEVALHGLALRPGGSAALGLACGVPVVLLPGDPLACLCAYELLAGRLVRRLAGRDPALPHPVREVEVGRKLVSAVGSLDVCLVRLEAGRAEPLGVWDFGGLAAAARADGFVLVPAALEGHAPGERVAVHLF